MASGVVNCSSPPSPIELRFGDITLNSKTSNSSDGKITINYIQGYGTDIVIGGQQMAPYINIAQADCFVNAALKNCSVIKTPTQSCPIGSRDKNGFQYAANTEVLSGGVVALDLSPYPTDLTNPDSQPPSSLGLHAMLPMRVGNNELNFTVRHSQPVNGFKIIPSYLGFGRDSELLNRTYNEGLVPSRSWSFFSGIIDPYATDDSTEDGSFVLGGYDAARLGGDFVKFDIPTDRKGACMLAAEITSIRWLNRTVSEKFTACITPASNRLQFPRPIFDTLAAAVNGPLTTQHRSYVFENIELRNPIIPAEVPGFDLWNTDINYLEQLYGDNTNMIVQINGIEITIPSRRIFYPKLAITDGQDTITIRNPYRSGTRDVTVDNIPNYMSIISYPEDGGDPTFGLPFLSAAYLMVNYEDSTFGLAPLANSPQKATNMTPILPPSCYPPPKNNTKTRNIALGVSIPLSIIAIALLTWGIVLFWKRRRSESEVPFIPEIPGRNVGPEKDGTELIELGGGQVYASGGNEVFHKDSNQVYQVTDDFGPGRPLVKYPEAGNSSVSLDRRYAPPSSFTGI
ncbi:hypothetical protein TWF281_004797 [Arthrobotrys megalospora]